MPLLRKKSSPSVTKNFGKTKKSSKVVTPYALKEFKKQMVSFGCRLQIKRWFFFLKTFGLDRISDLDITTASFTREEINIEETYKNSFGIISADGALPQEILLKFDNEQANYVKKLCHCIIHKPSFLKMKTRRFLKFCSAYL